MSEKSEKQNNINIIVEELRTGGQILKNVEWKFLNLSYKDVLFAQYINNQNKPYDEIKFADLNKKITGTCLLIGNLTKKTTELDTVVRGSDIEDELILDNVFKFNNFYRSVPFHQFLHKSNSVILKQNFCPYRKYFPDYLNESNPKHIYPKLDYDAFLLENEMSGGIDYKHNNNKVGFFLQNALFLRGNYEVLKKFKYSISKEDIKRNKEQKSFKISVVKNLNERTFLFRDNMNFDPIKKMNFSYAHKIIENNFDDANSSLKLKTETPLEDSLHQFKASYSNCFFDLNPSNFLKKNNKDKNMIYNNAHNENSLSYKISTSWNSSLNSNYVENKFFLRKFYIFGNSFLYQFNLEGGNLIQLNKDKNLKIHEYNYINNFKGINNPGEKAVIEEGKTGDCLGNNYNIVVKNKILYNNIPLISNYNIRKDNFEIAPFSYLNFLYCGNSDFKTLEYNRLHASVGFGVNVLTEVANVELYFNLFSKKNKYDVGPEFGINIGLD